MALIDDFDAEQFPGIGERFAEVSKARAALDGKWLTFLSDEDVRKQRAELREDQSDFLDNLLFVAVDPGGVLYGLWARGLLAGMWVMLDHDEIDLSPAWRSVDDLTSSLDEDGHPVPQLPDRAGRSTPEDHVRWAAVRAAYEPRFQQQYKEDAVGVYATFFGYCLIALTPRSEGESLVSFLTLDNQWLAERAAATLGDFGCHAAIPALQALGERNDNGGLAARGALKRLGAPR